MSGPIFLTLDQVLRLHQRQIAIFGGFPGTRDIGLVDSAVAQPQQSFQGVYLHKDLAEMAGAYLFYLTKNHGFVDGNKRIGAAAALTFLEINGIDTDSIDENEMEAMTIAVADGSANVQATFDFFRARIKP